MRALAMGAVVTTVAAAVANRFGEEGLSSDGSSFPYHVRKKGIK